MTAAELNSKFGAPGRIVFRAGFAGYPEAVIAGKYGSAEVALLGANVLSYRPTGHSQVLFRPAKRDYNRGDSLHGGVPVCWPQFGNRFSKDLPQHGFARKLLFEVRGTEYSEEKTEITLGVRSDAETKKIWNHDFDLEFSVCVSMKLNLKLVTRNTGGEPFEFSCGFHPYFLLRDRDGARIRGLDGCRFFNGVSGAADDLQTGDLVMDHATDHVYSLPAAAKHELAVLDGGLRRAIAVVSSGNTKAVVWNPGPEGRLADCAPGDWRKFVCVEPVSDWPGGGAVEPGGSHELLAAIQATLET
ncbi:MAG: D-hexose-6-phosphate mutarotase [Kiritimatiellae bacterium]|nr:D-hexose-6-phosphate mutarotase [Kiritimatiellia bacterium]